MITKYENGFEQIKISEKLDGVIENTINRAKKDKKRKRIRINLIKYVTGVASVFIAFSIGVNYIPVFAQSMSNVPVLSDIARVVQINYSNNIGSAINEGFSEDVQQSKMAGDIKITITNVVADNKNLYILYTFDGKEDKQELKNILLNNLQITDNKNNILIDIKEHNPISQILPDSVEGKQGDFLIPVDSYGYHCIVSSLGNNLESYSENQETTGLIQLSADNGKSIPDRIKLNILGFTEAYNTNYSKETYSNFISKFNRNPINIEANCSFNISIDKKLSSIKPESYNNIKFTADNTDFEIKYLNVYPTYIEAKIQLGKNKLDNSQCSSIINRIGSDSSGLPYLIDEKGNKYMPYVSHIALHSDNCQTITFDSSYFNQTKELYLVVNQITNKGIYKITPVKVKIK